MRMNIPLIKIDFLTISILLFITNHIKYIKHTKLPTMSQIYEASQEFYGALNLALATGNLRLAKQVKVDVVENRFKPFQDGLICDNLGVVYNNRTGEPIDNMHEKFNETVKDQETSLYTSLSDVNIRTNALKLLAPLQWALDNSTTPFSLEKYEKFRGVCLESCAPFPKFRVSKWTAPCPGNEGDEVDVDIASDDENYAQAQHDLKNNIEKNKIAYDKFLFDEKEKHYAMVVSILLKKFDSTVELSYSACLDPKTTYQYVCLCVVMLTRLKTLNN